MTTASLEYKITGLQRILAYKKTFDPGFEKDDVAISQFVNLFCEYQLADNNYMDIHFEANLYKENDEWFNNLSLDQVLQFITYIIWTDRFIPGYLNSKITDRTLFRLLSRIEEIDLRLILSPTIN